MKQLAIYSLVLIMFVLTGCPLLTINPIDNGTLESEPYMKGYWYEVNDMGKTEDGWLIERDLQKGNLTCFDLNSEGKPDRLNPKKIILSKVDGQYYLNVQNHGDDGTDEGYYLFSFNPVNSKQFILTAIKPSMIPYTSSQLEINKFLKVRGRDQSIYNLTEVTTFKKY